MFNINRIKFLSRSFWIVVMVITAHLCMVMTGCINDGPGGEEYSLQPGAVMPHFEVVTTDGDTISDESLAGRWSVIVLFSPDCPDCLRELPIMQKAYEERRLPGDGAVQDEVGEDADIRWICISRSATYEAVRNVWERERLTMPVSVQTDAAVFRLFASSGVPRVYIFGPDRRLVEELNLDR